MPRVDIASQGSTIEEAKQNLVEAIQLFLEVADSSETDHKRDWDRTSMLTNATSDIHCSVLHTLTYER